MGSARLAARLARLVSLALVCIASPAFAQVSGDGAEVTLYVPLVKEAGAPFVVTMNSSVPVEGFQFQLVTSNNGKRGVREGGRERGVTAFGCSRVMVWPRGT